MARLIEAVSEKATRYRGSTEAWSNVYIYRAPGVGVPSNAVLEAVADEIVQNERTIHGPSVQFIRVGISTPAYLNSDLSVFYQKNYDAAMPATAPVVNPEIAFLLKWPAGRNTKNRPVFLSKWYHPCSDGVAGVTFTSAVEAQQSQLAASTQTALETAAQNLAQVGPGPADFFELVSPTNRERTGPADAYPWLEHHELGDQWRN